MKLISMTDFIISQIKTDSTANDSLKKDLADVRNYALFLKQPLTLGMFYPCDEKGNPIIMNGGIPSKKKYDDFEKAKEKVLFKGFSIRTENKRKFVVIEGYEIEVSVLPKLKMTIDDLANDCGYIELTESAKKQIFG